MSIKEINEFQIVDVIKVIDKTPTLLLEHKQLKKQLSLSGAVLEAQYRVGNNYLLLITEDNPFEEALYIYYVNNHLKNIDSLELSAMYAQGMVRNLLIAAPDKIRFAFFDNNEEWLLTILPKATYSIFNDKYPIKRKTSFFHKKYLKLQKIS